MRMPMPQFEDRGGPVMEHPQLVSIVFENDLDAGELERFSRWIVTSSWLRAVGAEYRVQSGALLGFVQLAEPAPATISDDEIALRVYRGLIDGTLPRPAGAVTDALYMLHLPATTQVTAGSARSCVDFGAYHAATRIADWSFSVNYCPR
jgi:hypothetical protein